MGCRFNQVRILGRVALDLESITAGASVKEYPNFTRLKRFFILRWTQVRQPVDFARVVRQWSNELVRLRAIEINDFFGAVLNSLSTRSTSSLGFLIFCTCFLPTCTLCANEFVKSTYSHPPQGCCSQAESPMHDTNGFIVSCRN